MASTTHQQEPERSPKRAARGTRTPEAQNGHEGAAPAPIARAVDPPVARPPADRHRTALRSVESSPYASEKAALLLALQQSYGNRYVQRLLGDAPAEPGGEGAGPPAAPGNGRPLDPGVGRDMEERFGTSFSGVRVHSDTAAGAASRALGARAFTTGQDIYFSQGAYRPDTPEGERLLAHELTHTLQQRGAPIGTQPALVVVPPDDPLEREADRVADHVARGGRGVAPTPSGPSRGGMLMRQPADAPPRAPVSGPTPDGDFVIALGGLQVKKADIEAAARKGKYERDLSAVSLPGLKPKRLVVSLDKDPLGVEKGYVTADIEVPFVKTAGRAAAKLTFDKEGKVGFKAKAKLDAPALNDPDIELAVQDGAIAGQVTLTAEKLKPRGIPKLKIPEGSVTVGIVKGKLSGEGRVVLEYAGLARGDVTVTFKDGEPAGKGRVELTPEYLAGTAVDLTIAKGNLEGELTLPATKLAPPVPGLTITDGTVTVGMKNGVLSGKGEAIAFDYRGLGTGTLGFSVTRDHLEGRGELAIAIPGLTPVKGELRYAGGRLSGKATITADKFPKSLPLRSGSLTVLVDEHGAISGKGSVGISLLGVGSGELKLGYDKGILDVGAEVTLTKIPGLEDGRVRIGLKDGALEGEGEIGVAPAQIPGLTGNLHVVYKEDRFSGRAKIGYAKDKFSGNVELLLAQDDKGAMNISGSGEVRARLTDWLTGMVHIDVLPDASTRIAGELKADDVKIFDEKKDDRELFRIERNIPLWAILVAVIRVRGGVRGGIGPGWLRGVTATGTFSTVEGEEPSFSITGELFIPAYAEAYLAFGAGLGLDVLIGELTGGIEAVGTAGIYGAVSVVPEIEYANGDFTITGVATLAAGAKVKLGLNAWAEVEAFWVTVWEDEWKLAEWVWDVGPTLAVQASMKYVFGHPEPPSFELKTSDINAEQLVQDAMPKDGPRGSGAREALKNSAEWKGALKKAPAKDPSKIPAELADKQADAPQPKGLPPKKPKKTPPADLKTKDPAKTKEMLGKDLAGTTPDKTKAADPDHEKRRTEGMAELERLALRAKSDPEDSEEITKHLAALKSRYKFTVLEHRLEGEQWVIDAAMSPGRKFYIEAEDVEPEELIGGKTYGQLRGTSGITPDHEPQNAVMKYISGKSFTFKRDGKDTGIRPFPSGTKAADYTHSTGICLNMNRYRHEEFSRTWGPRGRDTKEDAVEAIEKAWKDVPDYKDVEKTRQAARKKVVGVVRGELAKDHRAIRSIYAKAAKKSKKVKQRLDDGIEAVRDANVRDYPEAFQE